MFVCSPQIWKYYFVLTTLILCLIFNFSCKPTTATKTKSEEFFRYEKSEFKFDPGNTDRFASENLIISTDGRGRILVQYDKKSLLDRKKIGRFFRISENGGKTFGREYKLAELIKSDEEFSGFGIQFLGKDLGLIAYQKGNIFFSRSVNGLEKWSAPVQINDEQDAYMGDLKILQSNENEIYSVWMDNRRGFSLIYFSASNDGGKTWSPNQPVDYDFREGKQHSPQFVIGARGRLLVFWEDWRDSKTLLDIRYSYSDDKGKNWLPSRKINDDDSEVWQLNPSVVVSGDHIYVAFADFRDQGKEEDNDWNIYFSRSIDNGTTFEKNKRLNDIFEGRDERPFLTTDINGDIFCIWWTSRETLFGQIAFAYSNDEGQSWSPSITLTDNEETIDPYGNSIAAISNEKFLFNLRKQSEEKPKTSYYILEKTNELLRPDNKKIKQENVVPIKFEKGESLFTDDFSDSAAEKWEVSQGFWNIENGTYMGVQPNRDIPPFISFAKFDEPEEYILEGRFRLDSVAHTAASIYFRSSDLRHYVITNRFRHGAWLSVKDDELPMTKNIISGKLLEQKRFSFQNSRWYRFRLVVTSARIDFYVGDRLLLSHREKLILPPGKFGIGGFYSSPTYFDDLKVSEIETED